MSRPFRDKNKDLVKLEVINSNKVWKRQSNGKYKLNRDLDIYGKVVKGFSSSIIKHNLKGENNKFVEDFAKLSKKNKNEITDKLLMKTKKLFI